jgi:hypothetical protein
MLARHCQQTFRAVLEQVVFVARDVFQANALDVIERRTETGCVSSSACAAWLMDWQRTTVTNASMSSIFICDFYNDDGGFSNSRIVFR